MRRKYSRLATTEEKRNIRTATAFGILTVIAIILLFIFGVPIISKFAGFTGNLGSTKNPIIKLDKTPPAPPRFNNLPDYTNQKSVKLTGTSEEGVTIELTFNGSKKESIVDNSGEFSFDLNLNNGENNFSAFATDQSGNKSRETNQYAITFDDEEPELTIESPENNKNYYGPNQKEVIIKGLTEKDVDLTVNDKFTSVNSDGAFEYKEQMQEGENKFSIKAVDKAGNLTEEELIVFFTP